MKGSIHQAFSKKPTATGLLERFRTSFWFLPALMFGAAITLAIVTTWIDRSGFVAGPVRTIYDGSAEATHRVLSGIAGSMITIATVTYSIMIVAMSFASGQLGPRLLRNFIRDRTNQVVLGGFLSIHVYCLALLALLRPTQTDGPNAVSVLTALLLAAVGVGLLIYFIHHIAVSLQADTVIAQVHKNLLEAANRLLPDPRDGDDSPDEPTLDQPTFAGSGASEAVAFNSERGGYIQSIDYDALVEIAQSANSRVVCPVLPGAFVANGGELAHLESCDGDIDSHAESMAHAFLIGTQRTDAQDLRYPIRQLAEIALRALSPGVNDPYTAITSIDHIGDALAHLATRRLVPQRVVDDSGNERLFRSVLRYRDLIAEGFDDIRRTSAGQVNVTVALLDVLGRVHRGARHSGCKKSLEEAARCVLDITMQKTLHCYDREAVERSASWLDAPHHILRVG